MFTIEKIKTSLMIVVALVLIVFAYAAYVYSSAYARSTLPTAYRTFSSSGEGKVTAEPDVAKFSFTVLTVGGVDATKAREDNNKKSGDIIDFLKKQGVDSKDIKTTGYNINPRYESYSCEGAGTVCPPPRIIGNEISNSVMVKVRDFKQKDLGALIAGVGSRGATNISSLQFTIDDPVALRNQAKEQAIAKARTQAELIAKAGGFRVGKLLSVDEGYLGGVAEGRGGADASAPVMMISKAVNVSPAPIESGSEEVTANVTLRFEIK